MYEWLNLELLDYKNKDDIWDLINLFEDVSFQKYSELPPRCPFVFLIQKYREINGNKSHKPIGFIFLETKDITSNDLYIHFGITEKERNKGYMKEALYILNHKLIGNTMEQEEDLKDYERLLISSNIIAINEENNPIIESLLINNSYYINDKTYYLGFNERKKLLIK